MAKGKAAAGFRMTARRKKLGLYSIEDENRYRAQHGMYLLGPDGKEIKDDEGGPHHPVIQTAPAPVKHETDEEIEAKLTERFSILETLASQASIGEIRSMFVSGPTGLGKSFTVEEVMKRSDPAGASYSFEKGYVRPTGLYTLLWQHRAPGKVLVFDDADSIFFDDVSLNLLKAVADTTDRRTVSYRSQTRLHDDIENVQIPTSFEFEGTLVFITNYDFDAEIARGNKLAPHLAALQSRSHYIDLAMKTRRDYVIRIRQVIRSGLLEGKGLTKAQQDMVMNFIEKNAPIMRELSLRTALKIADNIKASERNWESITRVTCCKNQ